MLEQFARKHQLIEIVADSLRGSSCLFHIPKQLILSNPLRPRRRCYQHRVPVAFNFWNPVILVRFWLANTFRTIMSMPKTTMNKNSSLPADPCKIRLSRQVFAVEAIACKARLPAKFAYCQFRRGVPIPDLPHIFRSAHWG